jgi:hypothetical protein
MKKDDVEFVIFNEFTGEIYGFCFGEKEAKKLCKKYKNATYSANA